MAELNFGLLTPPGSQSIGNAFVQGMDQAAVARAQENQNALSQYTLGKAKREDEQQNQLYRDIQDPNFKLDVRTALRYGPQGMAAFKAQQDAAAAALEARVKQSTLDANTAKLPGEQAKAFQEVLKPYSAAAYNSQNVDEAVANVRAMYANPPIAAVLTKIKPLEQAIADTTAAFSDPKTTDQWRQHWGGITPEKLFESAQRPGKTVDTDMGGSISRQTYNAQGVAVGAPTIIPKTPTLGSVPANLQASVALANAQDQGVVVPGVAPAPAAFPRITPQVQTQRNNEQIALLNAELSQPVNSNPADQQRIRAEIAKLSTGDPFAAPGGDPLRPATVVNNMPGAAAAAAAPTVNAMNAPSPREIREARAKGYAFNPDGTMSRISGGPADKTVVTRTPVQEVRFRKDLATDYTTTTATTQGMQDVLDSITDVKNSPGLAGATGISGMVYSFPGSQAAAAETNLVNLKGKVTSLGQTLANASGKIGPMALQEWTIVRDMVAALDKAVSKGETITREELTKIEFAAKNVAERVQDKFEGQYGDELSNYPQFATVPEPKSRLSGKIKPAGGGSVTAPKTPTVNIDALLKKYE